MKARTERAELLSVIAPQSRVLAQQFVVTGWESFNPKVGNTAPEVFRGMSDLTPLEFGIKRKDPNPILRTIPELADANPRIGHKQPPAIVVKREHLGYTVWPTGGKLSGQGRLERL